MTTVTTPKENYQSQPGQSWFDEYMAAVKNGLLRVWHWKFLWLWGILLPGGGFSGNFSSLGDDSSGGADELKMDKIVSFWNEYWQWILLAVVVALILSVVIWIISAVARSGVIQAQSELQEEGKPERFNFKSVWTLGKTRAKGLLAIDLIFAGVILLTILLLGGLGVGGFFLAKENPVLIPPLVLIAFLILLAFFLGLILVVFVRLVAEVRVALSGDRAVEALRAGYKLIRGNFKEVFKLMVINLILSLAGMLGAVAVTVALAAVTFVVGAIVVVSVGSLGDFSGPSLGFPAGIMIGLGIAIFVAIFALLKSLFALWSMDVRVWWVKRLQGVRSEEKKRLEEEADPILISSQAAVGVAKTEIEGA